MQSRPRSESPLQQAGCWAPEHWPEPLDGGGLLVGCGVGVGLAEVVVVHYFARRRRVLVCVEMKGNSIIDRMGEETYVGVGKGGTHGEGGAGNDSEDGEGLHFEG